MMEERVYLLARCMRLEAELTEYRLGLRTRASADMLDRIVHLRHTTVLTWQEIGIQVGLAKAVARQYYARYMKAVRGDG